MRFSIEGIPYRIEFSRERKQVRVGWDSKAGVAIYKPSRYAYTTASIFEDAPTTVLFRSFTVGCHSKDRFSLEQGRLNALKMLSMGNSLSKEFKKAMWTAYINRAKG